MKIIFNVIFLFFLFTKGISQTEGGIIKYGERIVNIGIDTSKIDNLGVKKIIVNQMNILKEALDGSKELYVLKFNKHESNFQNIPILENEANPNLKRAISQGVYYNNSDIKYRQIDAFGKMYLIHTKSDNLKWKITKETKKIGKYNCFKATTFITNDKKIKTPVIAWFTPEIPFSFGPKNYNGLPGLIVTLEERGHLYYAINFNFTKELVEVNMPKKGEKVTKEEFDKIGKKIFEGFKNNN